MSDFGMKRTQTEVQEYVSFCRGLCLAAPSAWNLINETHLVDDVRMLAELYLFRHIAELALFE